MVPRSIAPARQPPYERRHSLSQVRVPASPQRRLRRLIPRETRSLVQVEFLGECRRSPICPVAKERVCSSWKNAVPSSPKYVQSNKQRKLLITINNETQSAQSLRGDRRPIHIRVIISERGAGTKFSTRLHAKHDTHIDQ